MACRNIGVVWVALLVGMLWVSPAPASAPDAALQKWVQSKVPLAELPANYRESVRQVLEDPLLFSYGPAEIFSGSPRLYSWLLDHPDRGAQAWRKMGAKCLEIKDRGRGCFGWADGQGSDVHWRTVYDSERMRVWYAEGSVRPAPFLAAVPLRAVVVLRHLQGTESGSYALLQHQASVFVQTDSKTAALITKMMGLSAPRLAEQAMGQLALFFSGIVWYVERYPLRAESLGLVVEEK